MLAATLAQVCTDLQAEEASFWCVSEDGARMELTVNYGGDAQLLESLSVPVNESVVGLVQATRMATAIGPEDDYNPSVDAVTGGHTRAMVAAPVLGSEGVLGVVSAINPRTGDRFSGLHLTRLGQAASHLAQGIQRAGTHGR